MTNRPSVPEIITVNSEQLQTLIRDLLPSQNGFGSELQATNVITPIIDLTPTAEGSTLRADLQTALAFGSNTSFQCENTTKTLVTSPGFYRIVGTSSITSSSSRDNTKFNIVNGSTNLIWSHETGAVSAGESTASVTFDLVVWLKAGEQIDVVSASTNARITGSHRQIADPQGVFVQPNGFPL